MNEKFIPLSVPNLKGKEKEYVLNAVETEWVSTAGSYVTDFENYIKNYVKTKGAVACQSGTAGLHISLISCGVQPEDMVIVPTLTFIAAVNPVRYIGAEPVFMDCDNSLCMDPIKLERFCNECCIFEDGKLIYKGNNKVIKAMVVVHVFGNMADMESLIKIAKKYNIKVIEDATEALGTRYTDGKYSGKYAGTIGDVGVYSFNGNKIITTGGGGMIVSEDEDILKRAKHLTTQAKSDELNFIHDEIGYNYRLTNLQAALGLAQIEQLEGFIKAKEENYNYYKELFVDIDSISLLEFRDNTRSNHWFYAVYCDNMDIKRDELINYLIKQNIGVRPIWGLIHEQKPYETFFAYDVECAYRYWSRVINIPCSTNLSKEDVETVANTIKEYINGGR